MDAHVRAAGGAERPRVREVISLLANAAVATKRDTRTTLLHAFELMCLLAPMISGLARFHALALALPGVPSSIAVRDLVPGGPCSRRWFVCLRC